MSENVVSFKVEQIHVNDLYTQTVFKPLNKNGIFEEINDSWNKTIQTAKYADNGNSTYWNPKRFENNYYFVENAINTKSITIVNPFTKEEIISNTYVLTIEKTSCGFPNLICNYIFPDENLILGISLGTAMHSMFSEIIYLISYKHLYFLKCSFVNYENFTKYEYLDVLCGMMNIFKEKHDSYNEIKTKTIYGFHSAIGHTLCNDYTGLNILSYGDNCVLNKIDELIIGPNDPYYIANYMKNTNPFMTVTRLTEIDSFHLQTGKGVFLKYNHFYVTEKCIEKLKKELHLYRNLQIDNDICRIKSNYSPIFTINLRCGTNSMINQSIILSDVINILQIKYPNSFFLLEGFCGFEKEENENPAITMNGETYNTILEMYNNTVYEIIGKCNKNGNATNMKSIINLHLPNILKYLELADYGIYQNNTYILSTWICKVRGIYFGRPYTEHQKNIDKVSCENMIDINYINDKRKIIFLDDNTDRTVDDNGVIIDRRYIISAETIVDEVTLLVETK